MNEEFAVSPAISLSTQEVLDDSEYEEEEIYCVFEMGAKTAEESLQFANLSNFEISSLDTDTPLLSTGKQLYKGTKLEMLGTDLIFSETPESLQQQPKYIPLAVSSKKIAFKQVQLQPKATT